MKNILAIIGLIIIVIANKKKDKAVFRDCRVTNKPVIEDNGKKYVEYFRSEVGNTIVSMRYLADK